MGAQINCIDVAKSFYFKRNYVSVGLQNGNICIYDVESSKLKMECRNDSGAHITKCKFFPFGDLILSGDTKACLNIFAIADPKGQPAATFTGHKADIACFDFFDKGSELISGASDNLLILW